MPYFSIRKKITQQFHINDNEGDKVIGYEIIIICYLMVQLGLISNFKHTFLEWDNYVVAMQYPGNLLGKPNLTKCNI